MSKTLKDIEIVLDELKNSKGLKDWFSGGKSFYKMSSNNMTWNESKEVTV